MIFLFYVTVFVPVFHWRGVTTDLLYIVAFIIAIRCSGSLYSRHMMCIQASLYIMLVRDTPLFHCLRSVRNCTFGG